jgi:hypothetical protein
MEQPCIYLSYVNSDQPWADRLLALLGNTGIKTCNPQTALQPGQNIERSLREMILAATHILVLIGPTTRLSKWVDREIELSTEARENAPSAGLIGVLLESHEDFSRPYYDPGNIPLRLHDLIQSEYAIIRKWSEKPEEVSRWLDDATTRRHYFRSETSLRAAAEIYRFSWDRAVDESRPDPEAL